MYPSIAILTSTCQNRSLICSWGEDEITRNEQRYKIHGTDKLTWIVPFTSQGWSQGLKINFSNFSRKPGVFPAFSWAYACARHAFGTWSATWSYPTSNSSREYLQILNSSITIVPWGCRVVHQGDGSTPRRHFSPLLYSIFVELQGLVPRGPE